MAAKKGNFETLQLHAGQRQTGPPYARAVPIYATTSYTFRDTAHGKALFDLSEAGYIYSRIGNPTVDVLERRIAAMEGGVGALCCASGHAAQFLAIASLAVAGDNIVACSNLYGGTYNQMKITLPNLGIKVKLIESDKAEELARHIDANTKALYIETIANPGFNVPDIRACADAAHAAGIPLIVDNTFGCAGWVCRPIEHGADIVTLSATKWLGGHGTTLGGAVVDSGNFPWVQHAQRFPYLTGPSAGYHGLSFTEAFKQKAYIARVRAEVARDIGAPLNPFAAFLLLQGAETLSLRAQRHCENALALARWLETHERVLWCSYPGLESHPSHETAKRILKGGFGGVLAFGVKGGEAAGRKVIESLELVSHLANVGDAKSLAIHPWSTTHNQLTEKERLSSGVTEDLIRLSVGLEHIDDIKADFEQAFAKIDRSMGSKL